MARRLAEAGVPFIRVGRAWWDSHGQTLKRIQKWFPNWIVFSPHCWTTCGIEGMLDHTLVVVMGEFGRTQPSTRNWAVITSRGHGAP